MSKVPDHLRFVPTPGRFLLGIIAAPAAPAFGASLLDKSLFGDLIGLLGLGYLSAFTLFLPLMIMRLPATRHPLATCVIGGALTAPGPLGYGIALATLPSAPGMILLVLAVAAPLGAVGGFVSWLCVVWRSSEFAELRTLRVNS